ncbi:hypothetical protein DSO57_1001950 [Entomophthora muscae]|uniref:Uncharacterized protein n=1 Tax=Entomophthora muscae TaxID=34485 RepID=A0ACC2UUN3_9FUNG|nr:hypothetical protein DSO57_1001950 [Entomophthora muscae]
MGILKRRFLEGIAVRGMDGECTMLSELWQEKVVILKVMHRFRCPVCCYESRLLSDLKPYLDELNVQLVGVGEVGLQDFLDGKYWEWDMFVDPSHSVLSRLGLQMPLISRIASVLGLGRSGQEMQLCGTFVITPTRGLVYAYRQRATQAFPSVKKVFSIVGGDPSLVAESTPEKYLFDLRSSRLSYCL